MFSKTLLTFLVSGLVFGASHTHAQINFPEFSLSSTQDNSNTLNDNMVSGQSNSLLAIKNPLMRDILIIQDQINILEGLIERQAEIQNIANNYERIGLKFDQPAPSISICQQLPVNVLCLAHYPDLEVNKSIIGDGVERAQQRQVDAIQSAIDQINIEVAQENNITQQDMGATTDEPTYGWLDIKCLNGNCSALLVNNDNSALRMRVKVGDYLGNNGGYKITSISNTDVLAKKGKETITIHPISLTGARTGPNNTNQQTTSAMSSIGGALDNGANMLDSAEQVLIPAIPDIEQAEVAPPIDSPAMLGPTGLF
jgi:hypothetical protein